MKAWERMLLSELEGDASLRVSIERLHACLRLEEELLELPYERDADQLRWWLLECLDDVPLTSDADELWFRLTTSTWAGRVDSCDVELLAGEESDQFHAPIERVTWMPDNARLGSSTLPHLARSAEGALDARWKLCLSFTALAVRDALLGVDEGLFLRSLMSRSVTVGFEAGPGVYLGSFDGELWDTSQRCLYSEAD